MKKSIMFLAAFSYAAAFAAPSVGYQAATNIATHVTTTIVDRAYVEGLGVSSSPDRITNLTSFITADGKWAQRSNASASRWTTNDVLRSDWRDFTNMTEFAQYMRMNVYPTRTVNPNWTQKDSAGRTYGGEIGKLIEYYENQTYYKWGVDYATKAAYAKEANVADSSIILKVGGGYGPYPYRMKFDGGIFSDCQGRVVMEKTDPLHGTVLSVKTNAWVSDIYDIALCNKKNTTLSIYDNSTTPFAFWNVVTFKRDGVLHTNNIGYIEYLMEDGGIGILMNERNPENRDYAATYQIVGVNGSSAFGVPRNITFAVGTNAYYEISSLVPDGSYVMTSNKTEQVLASRKINGQSLSGDITITTMDYQELTNTVNAVKAQFYDQPLQVNWTMRMVNGEMKLYATTNVNQSVL